MKRILILLISIVTITSCFAQKRLNIADRIQIYRDGGVPVEDGFITTDADGKCYFITLDDLKSNLGLVPVSTCPADPYNGQTIYWQWFNFFTLALEQGHFYYDSILGNWVSLQVYSINIKSVQTELVLGRYRVQESYDQTSVTQSIGYRINDNANAIAIGAAYHCRVRTPGAKLLKIGFGVDERSINLGSTTGVKSGYAKFSPVMDGTPVAGKAAFEITDLTAPDDVVEFDITIYYRLTGCY